MSAIVGDSIKLSQPTPVGIEEKPEASTEVDAKTSGGRKWKIIKTVAFSVAVAAIGVVGLVSTAMLVLGVVAMFFPGIGTAAGAGLAALGGAISGAAAVSLGFVAANATGFVVGASVGLGVTGFASAVLVVVTRLCRKSKEESQGSVNDSDVTEGKETEEGATTEGTKKNEGADKGTPADETVPQNDGKAVA